MWATFPHGRSDRLTAVSVSRARRYFIPAPTHDLTENIIQPILARIEGDPVGTKGISIFLVPKYIVNDDGSLGRRNDYQIANVEKKMGIHGSATCLVKLWRQR